MYYSFVTPQITVYIYFKLSPFAPFFKKANAYRHYNSYLCLLTHTLPLSTPQDFLQMAKNAEYIVRNST